MCQQRRTSRRCGRLFGHTKTPSYRRISCKTRLGRLGEGTSDFVLLACVRARKEGEERDVQTYAASDDAAVAFVPWDEGVSAVGWVAELNDCVDCVFC